MRWIKNITSNRHSKKTGDSYFLLLNIFLFSVLGLFSIYILLYNTELLEQVQEDRLLLINFGILAIVIFDLLCFGIIKLNSVVNAHYPFAYQGVGRLFLFFIFVALLLFFYNYFLYALLRAMLHIPSAFNIGNNTMMLLMVSLTELVILCLVLLNYSARYTIQLYREKEILKQSQTMAEFKALQYQLNPHFLFNSLNTLLSEIEYDPGNAKVFTTRLAEVYRYILQTQDKKTVPLVEELDFLRAYIYLHQVRIGKGLRISLNMPQGDIKTILGYKRIPPLSLQLLLENVLKHNIISVKRPLNITLTISTEQNNIVVENDIRPKKNVNSLGSGLNNLAERYRIISGRQISIEKTEKTFRVELPILEEDEIE